MEGWRLNRKACIGLLLLALTNLPAVSRGDDLCEHAVGVVLTAGAGVYRARH